MFGVIFLLSMWNNSQLFNSHYQKVEWTPQPNQELSLEVNLMYLILLMGLLSDKAGVILKQLL